ncbi:N(6)-adenine-specific methyltransferase METTL4-like isoform X2 [Ostrea edulis]|nr:N(6)-adenine-specific methyltransferase METTL4-like isoform X2 [Ostrea edulis]XP_056017597.1 N(6)-adenine-specific methyltransferase METTL4-like isoform X2 [Ostrea edulis]
MALMLETTDGATGILINHDLALKKIYRNVKIRTQTFRSCFMKSDLFDIHEPYKMDSQIFAEQNAKDKEKTQRKKKRKRKIELNIGELEAREYHSKIVQRISEVHMKLILKAKEMKYIEEKNECKAKNLLETERESGTGIASPEYQQLTEVDNNQSARQAARTRETDTILRDVCLTETQSTKHQSPVTMLEHVQLSKCVNTVISNDWNNPGLCHIDAETYIIPHKSTFLLSDFTHHKMLYPNSGDELYDLIVLDPPWQNKSVKRKKMYGSLQDEDLLDIHMDKLAAPGCLVVVWVTNRMKHLKFVKETLFPNWAVTHLAEWHWLKITKYGEMVYDISSNHKKPYEIILIGRYSGTQSASDGKQETEEHTKQ